MDRPGRIFPLLLALVLLSGCAGPNEPGDVPEEEARRLLASAASNVTRFAYEIVTDGQGPLVNATGFHDGPNLTRHIQIHATIVVSLPEGTNHTLRDVQILATRLVDVYLERDGGWSIAASTQRPAEATHLGRYLFDPAVLESLNASVLHVREAHDVPHEGSRAVEIALFRPEAEGDVRVVVQRDPPRFLEVERRDVAGAPLVRFRYDEAAFEIPTPLARGIGFATAPETDPSPERPYQGLRFLASAGVRPGEVKLAVKDAELLSPAFRDAPVLGSMLLSAGNATIAGRTFRYLDLDEDGLLSRGDAISIETHPDAKPGVSFVLEDMLSGVSYPHPDLARVLAAQG